MDRALHFVLLLTVIPFTMQELLEVGNCKCAAFTQQTSKPLIEQALPYNVTCDDEGEEKCQQLCIALGRNTQESAAEMICDKLGGHAENLEISVYAKMCNSTSWKFTGLKAADPLCCNDGKSVTCEGPTAVIET